MSQDTVTLTKAQYEELKSHSQMLGQIGGYVESFCKGEEDTTLNAVLRLLAEYHSLMSDYHYTRLEALSGKEE
jgi:hypothetical protein